MREIRDISWAEGIETLLDSCLDVEPIATSLIFNILHKDSGLRIQINAMMSKDRIDDVLNKKLKNTFWFDPMLPVHIRRMSKQGEDIAIGNLELAIADQYRLIKDAFEENYRIGASEFELKMMPALPKPDLIKLADKTYNNGNEKRNFALQ